MHAYIHTYIHTYIYIIPYIQEDQRTTSGVNVNPCGTHSEHPVIETTHALAYERTEHAPSQLPTPLPSSKVTPLRSESKALVTPLTPQSSTEHRHPVTPLQPPKGREHQCLATCHRDTSFTVGLQLVSLQRVGIIPPKGQFYEEEAELALLQRLLLVAVGDRKECPDPIAATLEELEAQDSVST